MSLCNNLYVFVLLSKVYHNCISTVYISYLYCNEKKQNYRSFVSWISYDAKVNFHVDAKLGVFYK